MVLCHPLCFLFSRYMKSDLKSIKTALLNFYAPEDISSAKDLLTEHASKLPNAEELFKTPRRRDIEGRSAREIDDICSIIEAADRAKHLLKLPRYVSDGPEKMPTIHLVEGDMMAIMNRFDRMDKTISHLESCVRHVYKVAAPVASTQSTQSTVPLTGSLYTAATPAAQNDVNQVVRDLMNERDREPLREPPGPVLRSVPTHAGGRPIPESLRYTLQLTEEMNELYQLNMKKKEDMQHLQQRKSGYDSDMLGPSTSEWGATAANYYTTDSGSCDDLEGIWEKQVSRRSKRARNHSRLQDREYSLPPPGQPSGRSGVATVDSRPNESSRSSQQHSEGTRNYAAAVTKPGVDVNQARAQRPRPRRLPPPMLIGRKSSAPTFVQSPSSKVAAAKPYISKKVFCIDNVAKDVNEEDIVQFVRKIGVTVISCHSVKPLRTRWQIENGEEPKRSAFRLCVPREECDRLLNADVWPEHVAITSWRFFKKKPDVANAGYSDSAAGGRERGGQPAAVTESTLAAASSASGAAAAADGTIAAVSVVNATVNLDPPGDMSAEMDLDKTIE